VIVDTGVIYADIDRSDDWHASATELLSTAPGPLRVPFLVVTEVCYLLETRLGPAAEADFLAALSRHEFVVIPLTSSDYARAAELVRKHADLPLGGVDASVIAVAERLGDVDVATTDRRHFHAVREARGFTLHPAL
jgi:predicted nucleic acid-binding protein